MPIRRAWSPIAMHTLVSRFVTLTFLLSGCGSQVPAALHESFDVAAWLEDLAALEEALGHHYANLLDVAEARDLDLSEVHRQAVAEIDAGSDDRAAVLALMRLLAAFRDGHVDAKSLAAHPSLGATTKYAVGLAANTSQVVIARQDDPGCSIQRGDQVLRIDGVEVEALIAARVGLISSANDDDRRDYAARSLVSGRLAPKGGLTIEAMGDGRTSSCTLDPSPPTPSVPGPTLPTDLTRDTSPHDACLVMGSRDGEPPLPIDFQTQPEWQALPSDDGIAAGVFKTFSGRVIGILRLPFFKATRYQATCEGEWETFRASIDGICDSECQWRFTTRLENRLLAAIGRQVEALEAHKIGLLTADVSGNGGGSSFAEAVARILADVSFCSARSFQREAKNAAWMEDALRKMRSDFANPDLSAETRRAIEAATPKMEVLVADALKPCDASGVWNGHLPACRPTTRPLSTSCGLAPEIPVSLLQGASSATVLAHVAAYVLPPHRYQGPLAVLADRGSASAAELFSGILRDGGGAILVGEVTLGAGCGHVSYKEPFVLPRSGLSVYVPNCSAFGRTGRNEVLGLTPDVPVAFNVLDTPQDKANRVAARLGGLFDPKSETVDRGENQSPMNSTKQNQL